MFPNVIGPEIDSMEAFVRSFIDCEAIADDIGWGGLSGICDVAIDATVAGLRDLLTEQTVDVGSFYVLQTPAFGSTPPADVDLLESGITWGPCDLDVDTDARRLLGRAARWAGVGPLRMGRTLPNLDRRPGRLAGERRV